MRRDQHPKPFWRASRNCWYVQIAKKQIRLHPDRDESYRLYHQLMNRKPEEQISTPPDPIPSRLVVELLDAFLEWAGKNKALRTYEWYKENIQRFVDSIPVRAPFTWMARRLNGDLGEEVSDGTLFPRSPATDRRDGPAP